ncbi:Putative uncharacterized transposon-derived protein F54H12.3-like Protein [Tribolium castaneum]|uniref:Uncharacterized transposon-derived protein F54H12.3-like Protein n=1 Tax=Tribolium castaneum TaxID=7070 RepID=D7ELR1_TRICA|nr:Putative uncharacterized transposon-derived protein F54H12.3-like Protein [Tribolium castaneum]
MKSILLENKKQQLTPENLQTDAGTEFFNSNFKKLMQQFKINHYRTFSIKKAAIAERVIRTIKTKIFKLCLLLGTYKWIDKIEKIAKEYNASKHRTTGKAPIEVNSSNQHELMSKYNRLKIVDSNQKFKIGDFVRISKEKFLFEKGYTPNWSTEIFKIIKVNLTNPVTYLLEDLEGQPIKGGFYQAELKKTNFKDEYLVEKILNRKGDKVLVRWLGFPTDKDSWIGIKELL